MMAGDKHENKHKHVLLPPFVGAVVQSRAPLNQAGSGDQTAQNEANQE